MFRNTDLALRSRLDAWLVSQYGASWSDTISLAFLNPSKLFKFFESNEKINIGIQRIGTVREDRMRERESESSYLYLDDTTADTITAIPFPTPKILSYQIDIITWNTRGVNAQVDHNTIVERFFNAFTHAFKIGAVWEAGSWDILSSLECVQSENPITMDNQDGDGEFRIVFRYDCYTWLFSSLTPVNVGRIKYRIFEHFDIDDLFVRRHEPDA